MPCPRPSTHPLAGILPWVRYTSPTTYDAQESLRMSSGVHRRSSAASPPEQSRFWSAWWWAGKPFSASDGHRHREAVPTAIRCASWRSLRNGDVHRGYVQLCVGHSRPIFLAISCFAMPILASLAAIFGRLLVQGIAMSMKRNWEYVFQRVVPELRACFQTSLR